MLDVTTKVLKKKRVSLLLEQQVFKENKIIFSMKILLVFVRDGKPKPMPDNLYDILKS
jgi:acyl-CoA thioesterase FadM